MLSLHSSGRRSQSSESIAPRPRCRRADDSAHEDRSARRAVGAFEAERETDELVRPRVGRAEVETFEGYDTGAEELSMRLGVANREVVDPDEADASRDEIARARAGQPDEVRRELGELPEPGVPRLQQHALRVAERQRLEGSLVDVRLDRRRIDHLGGADEGLERQGLSPGGPVDEMQSTVDVRAVVHAELQLADVRLRAVGNRLVTLEPEAGVAGVDVHAVSNRNRDVEDDARDGLLSTDAAHPLSPALVFVPCATSPATGSPASRR